MVILDSLIQSSIDIKDWLIMNLKDLDLLFITKILSKYNISQNGIEVILQHENA